MGWGVRCLAGCCAFGFLLVIGCSERPAPVEPLSGEAALMAQGLQKSRMCLGCHGPKGISRVASYPSLAGRPADYLSEQLHAFRSGERQNPMMSSIATNLSDTDIEALAHYYASQPASETVSEVSSEESAQ